MEELNCKGQLIAYCSKFGLIAKFEEVSSTGPSHDRRFTVHVLVNDKKVGVGEDKKKRTAANIAAKMALLSLQNQEHIQDRVEHERAPVSENVVHPTTSPAQEPNYVGMFNEFCQRNGWMRYSFVADRRGPDHIPEFFCHAVIGERKFPEDKGKNKKEAKKNAAYLALRVLKKEDPTNVQLQWIPALDDGDVMQATSTSESKSANKMHSSRQTSEYLPSQPENRDSKASFIGNPVTPNRPHRRIELAAKFPGQEQVNCTVTKDPTFLQDFDDITELGSGGYGTVFKARKKIDTKYYVVKKVKRRSEKDDAEIKALANLEHPHIVRYYHSWPGEDVFPDDSCSGDSQKLKCFFIQMELCAKGTLENWIEKMEKIDKAKSLDIFQQIVDGVEYIHSKKFIHRDLKPANILFAENMVVKIADFGLVTPVSEELASERILRTAERGTKRYMAPEQEKKNYENEVDIFSLGLILIELFLKFSTSHAKQNEWEKIRKADLPPTFVKQFPSEESIIKLMLSVEPKKRPTAAKLKEYFKSKTTFHSNTL
ncbi:PREDICTED: interferon-induced, double-stranded RNA-activated protein kinase-like [Nanorana parkeri]|uniref:interferon-induced, double-stranded RNA-activated protein kinase-like n=1 Tax=Nanorana parkeri TaxID=125878 RepID=UPI000854D5AD|nr:PREDICTED: interferon-induced, double-stranded RNA-activated protein kinase-like [Nanorana parkeri]